LSDLAKKVSIIIPHWNGIPVIEECLESLKKTSYPNREIIVVDNASTDGSQAWIKHHHPDIILVENSRNLGYAGGCNSGAQNASGDYFVFLNNDTIQDSGWLEPLVESLQHNPNRAAVQPKIRNYFQRNLFDYAGGAGGEMDIFCFPFVRGRVFDSQEVDADQYNHPDSIFWSSGTATMVRAEAFVKAGGFDETFFAHMEEIDLCWRLQLMGYSIFYEPDSLIFHKNAVTLPQQSVMKYYLNHRNSLLMLLSNYTIPMAIYLFPIRFGLEWIAMFYAIVLRDWNHVVGILKALGWLLAHPNVILKKRKKVKALRKISDRELSQRFYQGSVVLAYYLLKRKTYGEIWSNPRV